MDKKALKFLFKDDIDLEILEHLPESFRILRSKMRKMMGIRNPPRGKTAEEMAPKVCPTCKKENPGTKRFCWSCDRPLDQITAVEVDFIYRQMEELAKIFEEK